jgi:GTP cyclohydrolase I
VRKSQEIRQRLIDQGRSFNCNDNISDLIQHGEMDQIMQEVTDSFQQVLDSLVIDTENDHNTQETARRVAKMFCLEVFAGRYQEKPRVTAFPNVTSYDQLYVTGPITIRSTCAHHFQNIHGKCYIGVFPGKNVIGLSKFNRLVDWLASRPTIQEELTVQIADLIEQETQADGIAVMVQAEHHCMTMRGVREHESDMTTAIMLGAFDSHAPLKQEFYDICLSMKGHR